MYRRCNARDIVHCTRSAAIACNHARLASLLLTLTLTACGGSGDGIGKIQPATQSGAQPGNGYTVTSIDITGSTQFAGAFSMRNVDIN